MEKTAQITQKIQFPLCDFASDSMRTIVAANAVTGLLL